MLTPEEMIKAAMAGIKPIDKPIELKPTNITVALPTVKPIVKTKADEVKTEPAKWDTEDGLPPRFIGGNLTPVNAKK